MNNEKLIDREMFDEIYKPMGKELVHEIIDIFIQEYPDRIAQIERDVTSRNMPSLAKSAHSLKGVVAAMYADGIVKVAEQLVQKGRNNDTVQLDELFQKLKTMLVKFLDELQEIKKDYS